MLRFVTARHNLLTLSTAVLLSATVVTEDIVGSGEAIRTVLLGAGSACVMLSLAAVASCLVVNPRLWRQPWAVVLGLEQQYASMDEGHKRKLPSELSRVSKVRNELPRRRPSYAPRQVARGTNDRPGINRAPLWLRRALLLLRWED